MEKAVAVIVTSEEVALEMNINLVVDTDVCCSAGSATFS
jgi:hypothetical protein